MSTFDYILDSVKDDLQGYSNFRKCIEAEEKLNCCPSVRTRYGGKDKHKLHLHNVKCYKHLV
jgi:hypothetical protein